GPDVPESLVKAFKATIERAPLAAGEAIAELSLTKSIGPGRNLRILALAVRARAGAKPGSKGKICFEDNLGGSSGDTFLQIFKGQNVVTVSPKRLCGISSTIGDITPPVILSKGDVLVPCPSRQGVRVDFDVSAADDCGKASLECSAPAGSLFPVGETTVLCRAEAGGGDVA